MLDQILGPVTTEEFFDTYWTKRLLYVQGPAQKFAHLFPWDVLNRALEEHRFDGKRLVLVKSGEKIRPDRYLTGHYVNSGSLTAELSNGATLVFNGCDEVHRPLRDLCLCLERLFHTRVVANLYAGWRRDNGFDVHWDTQDVMILQVAGRKHWKIWEPTRKYPFRKDSVDTSPSTRPTGEPVWDAVLQPGDLLSIPRGWWHVAIPVDEPCLHLTVTIRNLNGIDLLRWFAERMKTSESARMELPTIATPQERQEWLECLRADLVTAFDDGIMDRYLEEMNGRALSRPRLSLPAEADRSGNAIGRDAVVELSVAHPIHFREVDGKVLCRAGGVGWYVTPEVSEKLQMLNDGQPHTMAELVPRPDLRVAAAIGLLLMKGVLRRTDVRQANERAGSA